MTMQNLLRRYLTNPALPGMRAALTLTLGAAALLLPTPGQAAASAPVLIWSPTTTTGTYNYGTLDVGQTPTQMFTLTNAGGRASGSLTINLLGPSVLIVTDDECTGRSLGPGKTCGVGVEYAPTTDNENDTATLVASGEHASTSVTLEGATVAGTPNLTLSPGTSHGADSNGQKLCSYDFQLNGGRAITFMITNNGTGTSNPLSLVGVNSNWFPLSNDKCTGTALAPNGTCTFDITYLPPTTCSQSDTFTGSWSVNMQTNGYSYIALTLHGMCP